MCGSPRLWAAINCAKREGGIPIGTRIDLLPVDLNIPDVSGRAKKRLGKLGRREPAGAKSRTHQSGPEGSRPRRDAGHSLSNSLTDRLWRLCVSPQVVICQSTPRRARTCNLRFRRQSRCTRRKARKHLLCKQFTRLEDFCNLTHMIAKNRRESRYSWRRSGNYRLTVAAERMSCVGTTTTRER